MNEFYVYQHKTKDTNEIFYVGKGKGYRAFSKVRNKYWHHIANKHGFKVELIKSNMTEQDALQLELELTKQLKPRANICLGGGGVTGYKHGSEQLKKLKENAKGSKNPFYGKKHSEEFKKRLSLERKGMPTPYIKKPIICLSSGKFYNSITEASKELNILRAHIRMVLNGKIRHAKGLTFKYAGGMSCQE